MPLRVRASLKKPNPLIEMSRLEVYRITVLLFLIGFDKKV